MFITTYDQCFDQHKHDFSPCLSIIITYDQCFDQHKHDLSPCLSIIITYDQCFDQHKHDLLPCLFQRIHGLIRVVLATKSKRNRKRGRKRKKKERIVGKAMLTHPAKNATLLLCNWIELNTTALNSEKKKNPRMVFTQIASEPNQLHVVK